MWTEGNTKQRPITDCTETQLDSALQLAVTPLGMDIVTDLWSYIGEF